MSSEEASIFSTFLLFLLMFVFSTGEIEARKVEVQMCSSSYGDVKNISYHFRLKGDPAGCGHPELQLPCESNKIILEFNSAKYYVKRISYDKCTISVAEVNLANGSCSLPYKSFSLSAAYHDLYKSFSPRHYILRSFIYYYLDSFTYYVNCSSNIVDQAFTKVPCLSDNKSNVYVYLGSADTNDAISDLPESCVFISKVPVVLNRSVDNPSYEDLRKLLDSGFDFTWFEECSSYHPITNFFEDCKEDHEGVIRRFICYQYGIRKQILQDHFAYGFSMLINILLPEIIAVTNHFTHKLGQGGFGSVYKGQLHTGRLIAVKMMENSKFKFIHHVNVVQLLGLCSEGFKRALVYEYMPNGSLDRHIFSKENKGQTFGLEKPHEIALGTARGIEYLHNGCDVCILHFDIKPHNILLDHNFIPKVSDFGLAKFHPKENDFVSISDTRGTIGYLAPELISRNFGTVSCKSDVYGFGMVLLEMAGGRRNSNMNATRSSKAYFPSWVYDQLNKGGDLELRNVTEIESMIARKLCMIGLWCIQVKAADRPSMTKVLEMLEGSIDDLQMPPKPFFSSSRHISGRETESASLTELLVSESIEECSFNHSYA
ncbi:protein kinase domain-containing protein [Citrus sinensis]|uniref:Protein kinase domain-containing protein n=1 Tax=Citrus sinensis TaxID=2711 RepID=A0ACB8N3G7_CITSI|nr:protein kinase domain-containing protein [Citrus sinensis]